MTATHQIAIAGIGLVGQRHADSIRRNPFAELCGIVDPSDEGQSYAKSHDIACYETLFDLFQAQSPNGIILSTPTPLHVEQGLQCVRNGCALLVEKPIAIHSSEAMQLVDAADAANIPLLVGHHRRHNPLIQKAKSIVQSGAIGEVRAVHTQCWFYKPDHYFDIAPWRKKTGAGPISVNLVHDVDLIRHLCGEIIGVQAQTAPSSRGFENEEVAGAVLRMANGAVGTLTVSDGIVAPWSWEMTAREYPVYPPTDQSCYLIGGSEGSLSLPDLTFWNQNGQRDWWDPINATTVVRQSSNPLDNQVAHFLAVIAGDEAPLVSGVEGTRTLQVIEAIQTSAATGRAISVTPIDGARAAEVVV